MKPIIPQIITQYRIRKKGTKDQYSRGGRNPIFSVKAKVWNKLADIHLHLCGVDREGIYRSRSSTKSLDIYHDCEIVKTVFTLKEEKVFDAKDFLYEREFKKQSVSSQLAEEKQEKEKESRHELYLQLKKEFEVLEQ